MKKLAQVNSAKCANSEFNSLTLNKLDDYLLHHNWVIETTKETLFEETWIETTKKYIYIYIHKYF